MNPVIQRWHTAVNARDLTEAAATVTDPVRVLGPHGTADITPADFADWIVRSGITLIPRAWHPAGPGITIVEQDATWPGGETPQRVATVFHVKGDLIAAVLRHPDLKTARAT